MLLVKMSHMEPKDTGTFGRRGGPKVIQIDFLKGFEVCLYRDKCYIVV